MARDTFPPGLVKNVKLTAFVLIALILGVLAFRNLPDMSSLFSFDFNKPPAATPAPVPAAEPVTPAVAVRRSSAPRPAVSLGEARIIQPADPEPDPVVRPTGSNAAVVDAPQPAVPQPHAVVPPTVIIVDTRQPTQDSGNRVKKVAKKVGRFFGIGNDEYHAGPSVPQDASAPQKAD